MAISNKFILQQRSTLAALGRGVFARIRSQPGAPSIPGPLFEAELPPRSPELISAYLGWMGIDAAKYDGTLPSHLFPQWGFGLAVQTFARLDYPLLRAVNGGCRLQINGPIPSNEALIINAQLTDVDDDGYRAILTTQITSGTRSAPAALVADFRTFVPLARRPEADKKKEDRSVPAEAKAIETWRFASNAGFDYARLTGDFNPIHWISGYARRSGFKNTILHGFATMSRATEGLERALEGEGRSLSMLDARFTKPLVLPGAATLFTLGDEVWVGAAPGEPAYMMGTFAED